MAALGDEVLDGYMYPACVPYSYPYPYPPAAKSKGEAGGGGWRHRGGGYAPASSSSSSSSAGAAVSSFPGCGQLTAAEYFDSYQRAQLMALLSQVSPGLGPRPRRASSRDVAVQVNPRRDASVQCSLGRRTLLRRVRDSAPLAGPGLEGAAGPGLSPRDTGAGEGARWRAPRSPEQPPPVGRTEDAAAERSSPGSPEQAKERPRFQFLEQKYGYYHCKDCNIRWESAYVWCVQGTNKVYFKQFCRTCQKSYNPYRVEDITCQSCKQTRCSCTVKLRHVDPKRPHRQDLCGRCKGKRLSCDSTFSFKYII
ncbi:zygote arrest protein 1 [Ailuropoda melanoleuca]|uniref:zygote arrest protein 1 n=1 Tax=Ailuropoda melanoleuca TaxID=9646 RepID=UPI001494B8D2|nr:zygote arrest protein 1 [Ailuropoda melanoleuca]